MNQFICFFCCGDLLCITLACTLTSHRLTDGTLSQHGSFRTSKMDGCGPHILPLMWWFQLHQKYFLTRMGTHFSRVSMPLEAAMCSVGPRPTHTHLPTFKKHVCTYNTNQFLSVSKFNSEVLFSGKTQHALYELLKSTAKIQLPRRQHLLTVVGLALDCDFVGRQLNY